MIEKNNLLMKLEEKVKIINNLFYKKYCFAKKLDDKFIKIIKYWQNHSDTK